MSYFHEPPNMELDEFREQPDGWHVGDRVLAPWEPNWLYPGTIGQIQEGSLYIYFDDGDKGWVQAAAVRPIELAAGSLLFCRCRDRVSYLPAVVQMRNGEQMLIRFEDGEEVWTVLSMIRVYGGAGTPIPLPPDAIYHHEKTTHLVGSSEDNRGVSIVGDEDRWFMADLRVGDLVLAPWDKNWLHPAVITQMQRDEVCVQFANGALLWMLANSIRPFDIHVGSRVSCRWLGGAVYYFGTVKEMRGDTLYIHYDDGDREWSTIALIRVPANSRAATMGWLHTMLFGRFGAWLWIILLIVGGIIIASYLK